METIHVIGFAATLLMVLWGWCWVAIIMLYMLSDRDKGVTIAGRWVFKRHQNGDIYEQLREIERKLDEREVWIAKLEDTILEMGQRLGYNHE